jgi:glycosyltransferase involved in cell wall biosynthesis
MLNPFPEKRPHLSIVAPCYNEEGGIVEFHRRASAAATSIAGPDYELIIVNDGSQDRSRLILQALLSSDTNLVVVNLSRRHGHQTALSAGLEVARGDRIVSIDSDLQDPPEVIAEMWRTMDSDAADVVFGQRRERYGDSAVKRGTAALFYWLLARIGYADIPSNVGDFRMISRRVLDILNGMPEHHRFIRGMVSWIGLRQVPLIYDRDPRFAGNSHYPLARMMGLALDGLTSFSIAPLRIASYLGVLLSAISLLMLSYTLGSWALGRTVDGWTSLSTIMLTIGSAQLMLFGVLGEYVGRLYIESKRRPLYVIDEIATGCSPSLAPNAQSHAGSGAPEARKLHG